MQHTDTTVSAHATASTDSSTANSSAAPSQPINQAGLAFTWLVNSMPDWLWLRFETKAQAHYERIPDCMTCHYWAARMRGWLDFVFITAAFGLLFLCLKGLACI
jgi:hypothetical protein